MGGRNLEHYEKLNKALVYAFNRIMDIENRCLNVDKFSDLTSNDMHIIDVIGMEEPKNMSTIAKELFVTVGTLTIAMNGLVKKGYVERKRGEKDKRVVFIQLTNKGKDAFLHHKAFHDKMITGVIKNLSPEQIDVLGDALINLIDYFEEEYIKKES